MDRRILAFGIAIGLTLGTAMGAATSNLGLWTAVGGGLGLVAGWLEALTRASQPH